MSLEKVIASLKYLRLRPNIESYKWRFMIQKITFLTQALGIRTNYYFTIHVAGPYSPMLTSDYYRNSDRVNSLETDYDLAPEEIQILQKIRSCGNLLDNPLLIECTSTIVCLMKENPEIMDHTILTKTREFKPYLTEFICVAGLSKAKELLFKPEYLTEELKQEIAEWDRIE